MMKLTKEQIQYIYDLWYLGHSYKEIINAIKDEFDINITNNHIRYAKKVVDE